MGYVFAAYTIIWILMFVYLLSLGKRQANLAKELDVISEQLQAFDQKGR